MVGSFNKALFSDFSTGSIINLYAGETDDDFTSQTFTSPNGLPKEVFYNNSDKWEEVSKESSQTNGELSIIQQRGNELGKFLSPLTKMVDFGPG
jgi:hypothetical protein